MRSVDRAAPAESRSQFDPRKSTVRHDAATTEHLTASQHGFATELTGTMERPRNDPPPPQHRCAPRRLARDSSRCRRPCRVALSPSTAGARPRGRDRSSFSRVLWAFAERRRCRVAQTRRAHRRSNVLDSVGVARPDARRRRAHRHRRLAIAVARAPRRRANSCSFLVTARLLRGLRHRQLPRDRRRRRSAARPTRARRAAAARRNDSRPRSSRARLDYLEAQLQPHFLFNSLGAVSELAYDAPATANRVLRQLIAIFRTALAQKTDEVTLGEEIVGIEPYLDIQRIRFADWLTIDYHVRRRRRRLSAAAVHSPTARRERDSPRTERTKRGRDASRSRRRSIRESLIVRVTDNGVGLDGAPPSSRPRHRTRERARPTGDLVWRRRSPPSREQRQRRRGRRADDSRSPAKSEHRAAIARHADHAAVVESATTDLRVLRVPGLFRHPVVAIGAIWFMCGLIWTQQSVDVPDARDHRPTRFMVLHRAATT